MTQQTPTGQNTMTFSNQQVRALISHTTSAWAVESDSKRLIDYIQDPYKSHLIPRFTIHLNRSEDYVCNQALLIYSSTEVKFFTFDPTIKTGMRLRHGSPITFYEEEIAEENKEGSHFASLQFFHKGNTFFSLVTVPGKLFS